MRKYYYGSNNTFYKAVGSDVYYFSFDKVWTRHSNVSLDRLFHAYRYMKMQINEVSKKYIKLKGMPL